MDLGWSPGSWLQYASRKVGEEGEVLGVDLKPVNYSLPALAARNFQLNPFAGKPGNNTGSKSRYI